MRKSLAQIRAAVLKWEREIHVQYDGGEADEISQRYAASIVRAIDQIS